MALKLESAAPPLVFSPDGVVRVSGTRGTLDTVVYAFRTGAAAEEIVLKYPSLDLADGPASADGLGLVERAGLGVVDGHQADVVGPGQGECPKWE